MMVVKVFMTKTPQLVHKLLDNYKAMSEIEKRSVDQFKVYILVVHVKGKNDNVQKVEHAVFTGKGILDTYATAYARNTEGVEETSVREEWKDVEPKAENFSLPFNPVFKQEPKEEE